MTKRSVRTAVLTLTAFAGAGLAGPAAAQVEVGNGGDVIYCRPDLPDAEFQGWYFLDYVATWDSVAGREAFHDAADPLALIIDLVMARQPALGLNLQEFADEARRQIRDGADPTKPFIWMRTSNGLLALKDEQLSFLPESFPENCFEPGHGGGTRELRLHQVVIHQERPNARVFKYDPAVAARIISDPVQASMLIVHEWLWQYSPNATVSRDVNRFLHTKALADTDSRTFKQALLNLGLDLSRIPPARAEILLESNDPAGLPLREIPVDPDFGVEVRVVNGAQGYFIIEFATDGHFGTKIAWLRPAAIGGPVELRQTYHGSGDVFIAACDPVTQDCGPRRRVAHLK